MIPPFLPSPPPPPMILLSLPSWTRNRSKALQEGDQPYNILIRSLTTAVNSRLKDCLGEFLWQLCDEDGNSIERLTAYFHLFLTATCENTFKATRFVHYVSYESAAGVLMKKGLLQVPAPTDKSVDDRGHPLSRAHHPPVDLMTGAFRNSSSSSAAAPTAAGAGMTEEEKRVESARLLDLFERLNRTGIIRVELPEDLKPGRHE